MTFFYYWKDQIYRLGCIGLGADIGYGLNSIFKFNEPVEISFVYIIIFSISFLLVGSLTRYVTGDKNLLNFLFGEKNLN